MAEIDLFDLTEQPQGIITGDLGQPLFSIEKASLFQYNGGNTRQIARHSETGIESLRYSTNYAQSVRNHKYKVSFDFKVLETPASTSKLELQFYTGGKYPDDATTFFTIDENDFLPVNQSKHFEVEFIPSITGFLIQLKLTDTMCHIENFKVIDIGETNPDDGVRTPGGGSSTDSYVRACLCHPSGDGDHGTTGDSFGSFADDLEYWFEYIAEDNWLLNYIQGGNFSFDGFNKNKIPEMFYPSNCIGYDYAYETWYAQNPMAGWGLVIYHDPKLCIFGGAEIDPEKEKTPPRNQGRVGSVEESRAILESIFKRNNKWS